MKNLKLFYVLFILFSGNMSIFSQISTTSISEQKVTENNIIKNDFNFKNNGDCETTKEINDLFQKSNHQQMISLACFTFSTTVLVVNHESRNRNYIISYITPRIIGIIGLTFQISSIVTKSKANNLLNKHTTNLNLKSNQNGLTLVYEF